MRCPIGNNENPKNCKHKLCIYNIKGKCNIVNAVKIKLTK